MAQPRRAARHHAVQHGIGTTSATASQRLPTLNRNFTDFVKMTPQVSVPGAGISGGGVQPHEQRADRRRVRARRLRTRRYGHTGLRVSAKGISIDAVKEYQVLLAPFDVRQGNFGGLLLNAVTKSGTNEFHGSGYDFMRDEKITRTHDYLHDFNQKQYGFTLGGPIIKDRAFFFINPEWQKQEQPTSGPFIGSTDSPIDRPTVERVNTELAKYGIHGGTGDIIPQRNPLTNIFARIDVNLPCSSRLKLSHNYSDGFRTNFSRSATGDFRLTSNSYEFTSKKHATLGQLFTNWSSGASNELSIGYTTIDDFRTVPQRRAADHRLGPAHERHGLGAGRRRHGAFVAGQRALCESILEIADNITIPVGTHNITVGTKNFLYYSDNLFAQDRYGTWIFQSLDSLRGTCAHCAGQPPASSYTHAHSGRRAGAREVQRRDLRLLHPGPVEDPSHDEPHGRSPHGHPGLPGQAARQSGDPHRVQPPHRGSAERQDRVAAAPWLQLGRDGR